MKTTTRTLAVSLGLAALMCAASAHAVERGWYVGLGGGLSRLSPDTDGSPFTLEDESSAAVGILGGYDISDRFSLELGYTNLGVAGLSANEDIGYTALSAGAVLYLLGDAEDIAARDGLSAYFRLGLSSIDNSSDIQLEKADNTSVWAGIGVEMPLRQRLALRGELLSFDGDAQAVMVSILFRPGKQRYPNVTARPVTSSEPAPSDLPASEPTPDATASRDEKAEDVAGSEPSASLEAVADCPEPVGNEPVDDSGCALFSGVLRGVDFAPASAALTPVARQLLDRLAASLLQYPAVAVEIAAHTEAFDSTDTAKRIARERAVAVARHLAGQGVPVARLKARAFGSSRPRESNATAGGRRLNNRIALSVQQP